MGQKVLTYQQTQIFLLTTYGTFLTPHTLYTAQSSSDLCGGMKLIIAADVLKVNGLLCLFDVFVVFLTVNS